MLLCVFALAVFNIMVEAVYTNKNGAAEKIPKNLREFQFMKQCEKPKIFILVKQYYYIYEMKEFMAFIGFAEIALR